MRSTIPIAGQSGGGESRAPSVTPTATGTGSVSAGATCGRRGSRTGFASRSYRPSSSGRYLLEGEASGELEGYGRWRFFEQPAPGGQLVTAVLYDWHVRTSKRWMNALAPIAGPLFSSNHDWVMRNGATGLARRLGCRLLAAD